MAEVKTNELDPPISTENQTDSFKTEPQAVTRPEVVRKVPYVSLPRLSQSERSSYTSLIPDLDETIKVNEVVGEVEDDLKGPLYYGRYDEGIIMGFPMHAFARRYPDLIAAYERKKQDGTLEPFDPTGSKVHPKWRVKFKLTIDKRKRRASVSASSAHGSNHSDDESEELESEDVVSGDAYNGEERATRRSIRSKAHRTELPFSPKKTRSRVVYPAPDSDEYSDAPITRRYSQRTKRTRISLEDAFQSGESDSDDYIGHKYRAVKSKGKGRARGTKSVYTGTAPAFGLFRSTAEFDEDPDPETRELRAHWMMCGKCHDYPSHILLEKERKRAKKGKRRANHSDDDIEEDEVERLKSLGGWVRCLKCPVSVHWSCLSRTDQEDILKAVRERDRLEWLKVHEGEDLNMEKDGPRKRPGLDTNQITEFICNYCSKGGLCMGCLETIPAQNKLSGEQRKDTDNDTNMNIASSSVIPSPKASTSSDAQLLFRCFTCKRPSHYRHIQDDIGPEDDLADIASNYQLNWFCRDCGSYRWSLDKILAWRPYPANAIQPAQPLIIKEPLPREYLVKWQERGYRRTEWVPHMWLVSTHYSKLKNFLTNGTKIELLEPATEKISEEEPASLFDIPDESSTAKPKPDNNSSLLSPLVDAEDRIPPGWKTVDRVLDIQLRFIPRTLTKPKNQGGRQKSLVVHSEEEKESEPEEAKKAFNAASEKGEEPKGFVSSVDEFESRTGIKFDAQDHVDLVIWGFFKWVDLGYEEATWDAPPKATDPAYPAFQQALKRFSQAREVQVEKYSKEKLSVFLDRQKDFFRKKLALKGADELDLGQDPTLKLMPFQVEGFNWLCSNWWNKQTCILADEMGLGKTVQITSFIGYIMKHYNAMPALVVVPNSTITNWVREFERWAPSLRVVPFYGESKARDVVKRFELSHSKVAKGTTGSKFHVLVTTYEAVVNPKDFGSVFKSQPRWEVLVIDEGQRLKSDSSLLFRKLNELSTGHRVIMTGTPLNNNMRELFNLMNFLDPAEWNDLDAMEREYADLDEDLIKNLHNRLRPYFLRRIKSEVLDLPPKNEVIVPVSMTSLQKEVYRSILSHNLELLQGLMQSAGPNPNPRKATTVKNMLMQLRKCLQHPYLNDEAIEPKGLGPKETHEKLIDASAKLRLLKDLLPKLKARGHRVLIFSQFVIALNIIEDFLVGEGHKFLRLDGNTKGMDRQKGMDEFNRPNSDVFVYLLTTRAGGVGINLFTADTVIIFDPDFNPHQDLQAIARAHRYGQKKTCLVFKLMVKESAEERIMQIGKKKLVLDHLIVQKMDDDESAGENVQSILTYGAQQLFDESNGHAREIVYSELDIDNLIAKTEKEGDQEAAPKEGAAFSFAKVWTADKDELEEIADEDQFEVDSWAQTLQRINDERAKKQVQEEEEYGKGGRRNARRKAAASTNYALDIDSLAKNRRQTGSDADSAYGTDHISDASDSSEDEPDAIVEEEFESPKSKKAKSKGILSDPFPSTNVSLCGLCGQIHGPGNCQMTESSENLIEYREMLIMHTEDESYEERCAAVNSIDEVLRRRGHASMIYGQPLYPVRSLRSVLAKKQAPAVPRQQEPDVARFAPVPHLPGPVQTQSHAGPSNVVPIMGWKHQATSQTISNNVSSSAGPSTVHQNGSRVSASSTKRPLSPSSSERISKRSKQQAISLDVCAVCHGRPAHRLNACPIVAGDLLTLFTTVDRLSTDPVTASLAEMLRKYAIRRQNQEGNQ
ncbi:SNF2 family DNA-dependent ATPase [Lentinula aciculospora]|uniref:SNF2 family DNA-dependent ATPase n=1 Tax=Lentinula aciculospora TaxID=153920 RepID=A0A9W9DTX7_9AGAR|nr:SNF2 family DNA-dependent ATPase [Lentinula aciculospora]